MYRPLALFLGLRYSRARRSSGFVSFISASSVIGITLGVMALILGLSAMNGFERELPPNTAWQNQIKAKDAAECHST